MPPAVKFDQYGDVEVLQVVEVDRPDPGPGQVLVRVKAAGINPGEALIRKGLLHELWPATFPSGEGTDLAGVVEELGAGAEGWAVGDEVIGFTDNRASHAELVVVEASNLTRKPGGVSWEAAGALFVAGATAWAAARAVSVSEGDTVIVSGAAGGIGSLAVQLARHAGATQDRWQRRRRERRGAGRARRVDRRGTARDPDCKGVSARARPGGVQRARASSHARQDRAEAVSPRRPAKPCHGASGTDTSRSPLDLGPIAPGNRPAPAAR